MVNKRDYYEVLGVAQEADQSAIKNAFRRLAIKYHPDRNKEPDAEERFKEIAEAYAVLSDPEKRAQYDARGHAGFAGVTPEDLFGGIDFEDLFAGFDLGGGIFERWFDRRARPRRGADIQVELAVPLERTFYGGEETVRVSHPRTCPTCRGSGAKPGTAPRVCDVCAGSGLQTKRLERRGGVHIQRSTTCPRCGGRGRTIDQPCVECGGTGRTVHEEDLTVKILRGFEEGTALRIAGHGMPAPQAGAPPGDLFVIVRTTPDRRFRRHGKDLWRAETIGVTDAVLGTEITVPTLDGEVNVKVPAGIQPDQTLRVRGKGLPEFGSDRYGDLLLSFQLRIPEQLSRKERELYSRLRELGG